MYGGGGGGQWPGQQQQQQQQQQYMQPQQTGFMGVPQQRPMMTGMPPQQQQGGSFLGSQQQMQPQPTGFAPGMNMGMGYNAGLGGLRQPSYGQAPGGMMGGGQQRFLSPNPMQMQPQQTGMMQPQQTGMMQSQQTGMISSSSSPRPMMGMQPQITGYSGSPMQMQQTGLMPQMTGLPMDPRLQLMSMQFLPAAQPYSGAPVPSNMNFNSASMQPASFQSSIQNLSQQQQGSKEPKIPWALSKEERKSYDSIFRAWDQKGTGFVSGDVAIEVFGQSGLDRDRLMQVWHLSDTENRGKLNLAEFHVAMGLIYRALNGNDLPEHLPAELIPPSARDLNDSVDFLKDLLKRDTNVRNTTGLNLPESGSNKNAAYGKTHSFHENPIQKQDAAAYKHSDDVGSGYKSSSRHLDRRTVRYGGESATDDLSEMKRQLAHTQKMLDDSEEKDEEDREVEKEMDELRFRIKRVQDDIDYYNRRGGRDAGENRRKAERELMHLMHERLPLMEKRLEEKDRKQREKRAGESKIRDRRNEDFEARREYSYTSSRDNDDLSRSRTPSSRYDDRDRYDDRRDRDQESSRSSPAPAPPAASKSTPAPAPVAAPFVAPTPPPAPASPALSSSIQPKNMTPEEKLAWTRSEAQRRIQERMRALGLAVPSSAPLTPSVTGQADPSVEQRLAADRVEAQAKASQADAEAIARDDSRRARLEEQRIAQDKSAIRTVKAELQTQAESASAPPAPVLQAAREEVDEQEEMLKRREEVLKKEKEERLARFKRLEDEEAEAARQEEAFKQKQEMFSAKSSALPAPIRKGKGGPPPPPPSRSKIASTPSVPIVAPAVALSSPEQPPTPLSPPQSASIPIIASPSGSSSTNPFHRMQTNGSQTSGSAVSPAAPTAPAAPSAPSAPAAPVGGKNNPFFRSQQADQVDTSSGLPSPQRAAGPAIVSAVSASSAVGTFASARAPVDDDDWGEEHDHHDDDDDGPGSTTRATRQNLAQALFSGLVPSASPGPSTPTARQVSTMSPAPQSPVAPSAPAPPPPPPAAPLAPSAAIPSASAGPSNRGALMGAIQGGLQLRKAKTNDRSGAAVSGAVIGDASAPIQTFVPPPVHPTNESAMDDSLASANPNRQSVDWASHLASDQMNNNVKASTLPEEPSVREEEEDSDDFKDTVEDMGGLNLDATNGGSTFARNGAIAHSDELDDFDMSKTVRVRSLYAYEGQRQEDLSFAENIVIMAHPAKEESNDWWYGRLANGAKGAFPRTYVQNIDKLKQAKALYDFTASSPEEMSFSAEQHMQIVDDEDDHWWKVINDEQRILIVPSIYVELVEAYNATSDASATTTRSIAEKGRANEVVAKDSSRASVLSTYPSENLHPNSSVIPIANDQIEEKKEVPKYATNEQAQLERAIAESKQTSEFATLSDEDEELQRVIRESERDARLESVARARDEKDLRRTLEISAKEDLAGSDTSDGEDEGSDSTTGWTSSEEEEESDEEEESEEAMQLRVAERIRVLEAAGILQLGGDSQSQLPIEAENTMLRRKTIKKPKPERPERLIHRPKKPSRPPPSKPQIEKAPEVETDDAYDRYVKMSKEVQQQVHQAGNVQATNSAIVAVSPPSSPPPATSFSGSGLLSTIRGITRMGAASPAERKVTPTISGPMSVRTNSPRVNSPTPTTASVDTLSSSQTLVTTTAASEYSASSWSSIIGSPALTDIPERERKRQEAIFELIRTEGTHVRDLQTIVEVFFNAMKDSPFLSPKAQTVIFANVEEVLFTAVSLLSELENRQKESRLYVTKVGDILQEHMKNMSTYLPYCVNQTTARQILTSERSRNVELDKVLVDLRNQHPAARGLDLSSFLLTPMQRLTRYPLLISQIVRYTDQQEADEKEWKDLHSAMSTSQRLLDTVNEAIRLRENNEKLQLISNNISRGQVKLDLTKPTRWMGQRTIIREEILSKQKSGRKVEVILCSDLLLLLSGDRLYRIPMPLEEIVVRDVPTGITGRDDFSFQIVHQGREKTNLRCNSARACHTWMHSIESARADCLSAANKINRSRNSYGSSIS